MAYHNPKPPPSFAGCFFGFAMIGIVVLCGLVMLVASAPR
jgi:hypothetical protein